MKKTDNNQGNLEYITISDPKIDETKKANFYISEVYLSASKVKKYPIYGVNPIDTICLVSEFTSIYLQTLVKKGYVISKIESKEPWKLGKMSDNYLQEKMDEIKNKKKYFS